MDVSAVFLNKMLQKLKDQGAPLISYEIRGVSFHNVLLDPRSSINLLPSVVYDT